MPYTPGQKAYILQDNGYDPSKYDLDEEGNVYPLETQTRANPPAPVQSTFAATPEAPSKLATAGRSAAESVIPTIGALGASLGAAALTDGASIPVQILAGLAAGTAGGFGASKLQEAVVPDTVKEAIFTRPEDALNPWTRAGAGLIPMLLTHSPTAGVKDLAGIASKVPNMIRNPAFAGKTLTDAEQAALINAGVGVGAGTGINAGIQLANGGELNLPELAAAAAGGAIFNNPRNTALNRAIGLKPVPASEPITVPKASVPDTWSPVIPELGPPRWTPLPDLPAPGINNPAYLAEALRAQEAIKKAAVDRQTAYEASLAKDKANRPINEAQPEIANPYQVDHPLLPATPDEIALQKQIEAIQTKHLLEGVPEPKLPPAPKTVGATTMSPEEAAFAIKRLQREGYLSQKWEGPAKEPAKPSVTTEDILGPRDTLYKEGTLAESNSTPISAEAKQIAKQRGVNVADEPTLPPNVQGLNYQPARQVRLNPKNSNTATLGHEVNHQFVADLRKSTDPKDQAIVKRAEEIAKRVGAKTPQEIDEFIANVVGEDFSRRMQLRMAGSTKQKFKSWLKDLKDAWDYYRGSDDPANRLLALRTLTDAPYGTRKEIVNERQRTSPVQGVSQELRPDQRGGSSQESSLPGGTSSSTEGRGSEEVGSNPSSNPSASGIPSFRSAESTPAEVKSVAGSTNPDNTRVSSTSTEGTYREGQGGSSGSGPSNTEASSNTASSVNKLENTDTTKFSQGEAGAETPASPSEERAFKRTGVPGIRSRIDAVKAKVGELGEKGVTAIKAIEDFAAKHTRYAGEYKEKLMYELRDKLGLKMRPTNVKNWLAGDSLTARRVLEHLDNLSDNKPGLDLTPKEEEVVKDLRAVMLKIREDQNTRAGLREGGVDPDYFPQTISREVINIIKNKPNSLEAANYRKEYLDYVSNKIVEKSKGKTSFEEAGKQAETLYSNLLKGFSQENVNLAKSFGPIDKAEGYGIPPSMREQNLVRRLNNYLERTALRFAHYDAIEANPDVAEALFGKEGIIANDTIRSIYQRMGGIRPPTEQVVEGVTGIIKAAVTGTAAGIRDVVTTPVLGAQHQDFLQLPRTAIKSALDIAKNWKESFGQGINRVHIGSLESGDTNAGWPGGLNILHRLRDVGNEVQFRNWLEQLSRTWAYSNGKVLATENLIAASRGKASRQQKKFLDDFGPEGWGDKVESLSTDTAAIKEIATKYAESIAGTYDARGLPSWALEGPLAPMLSLNRWSIEKTNNFVKYTLDPMKEGNFTPFLNQTAWLMLGGGAAIEALNELLNNKKSKLPSVKELEAAKDLGGNWKEGTIYKAIGLAALSGYFGEAANLTKLMADAHYKNSDRWYNLMVAEFAHRTASYVPHFTDALLHKDIDLALDIASDYISEYSQTWRVLSHQISKERKDELLSQDENRDVKVFKQLMDKDLGEIPTDVVKDYSKEYQRKFHKARTFEKTAEVFPKAREEAMRDVKTEEDYKSATRGLGAASYRGYPSVDNSPIEAMQFNQFLSKSQGDKAAQERLIESLRMKELNKVKRQISH